MTANAVARTTTARPATVAPGTSRGLWWFHPAGVILAVVPLSLLLAVRTSDRTFRLLYNTPRSLTSGQSLLFLAAGMLLLLGCLLPLALRAPRAMTTWPGLTERQLDRVERASTVCFRLTVVGYVAFGAAGIVRGVTPTQLFGVITAQDTYSASLKQAFVPVPGITSLTQVGMAYVVLAGLLLVSGRSGVRRRLTIVLLLGTLRAFFLTERLAVLELVVPLVALLALGRHQRPGAGWLKAAPLLALPLVVVVFGVFEYSRSWVYFRSRTTSSYPGFVIDRLAGYYATAYNNGSVQLLHTDREGRLPYASIEALWTAPGVAQLGLYDRLSAGGAPGSFQTLLEQYATPEFNNPGGLAVPLVDFGVVGGLVAFLVVGVLVGLCYRGFRQGSPLGLVLYPLVFTGLLELPRYFYWGQGRLVPAVVALVAAAVYLKRAPGATAVPPPARSLVGAP